MQRVFDAHFHIIDPDFPLQENNGYLPDPFGVTQYQERIADLGVSGGAVVSGSFQGFDQGYLIAALEALGPHYVGVTQIPADTEDEKILELHRHGVRAVRFNVRRGGSASLEDLDRLARRVYDLVGWHTELYIDARELPEIMPVVSALPAVSVDHLGLHEEGLLSLLALVERGMKVKATGFGRIELDPTKAIKEIVKANPHALMVGTDLPSTRARRPFQDTDFALICDALDEEQVEDVFWNNAADWYLR
ncbi:amidohydrolase family protein [Corynebacterium lowii]|uniref:amidohydrolase family protein n=1 Tax=Corynebacterium lowii TaxID=1544413 RepID=UPI0006DD02E0|nr:amidohydrolase family protein [Corynebacterium lowii]